MFVTATKHPFGTRQAVNNPRVNRLPNEFRRPQPVQRCDCVWGDADWVWTALARGGGASSPYALRLRTDAQNDLRVPNIAEFWRTSGSFGTILGGAAWRECLPKARFLHTHIPDSCKNYFAQPQTYRVLDHHRTIFCTYSLPRS